MERQSIFNINIPREYQAFLEDTLRIIIIQITTTYLMNISNNQNKFLNKDFIKSLLFILVGVGLYWLVFKKIVSFNKNVTQYGFYHGSENKYEY